MLWDGTLLLGVWRWLERISQNGDGKSWADLTDGMTKRSWHRLFLAHAAPPPQPTTPHDVFPAEAQLDLPPSLQTAPGLSAGDVAAHRPGSHFIESLEPQSSCAEEESSDRVRLGYA